MACFFIGIDSYGFGRKAYTSRFFTSFSNVMVVVIYSMLAVAIQDLALSGITKSWPPKKTRFGLSQQVKREQPVHRHLLYSPALKQTHRAHTQ